MILKIKSHFDAAHKLPNYQGKCSNLHGHRWEVILHLEFPSPNLSTGMCMDFGIVKEALGQLLEKFDHQYLNDLMTNPTAENIALELYKACQFAFGSRFQKIEVWETPDCGVEV